MGTLHYAVIQHQEKDSVLWHTIATFEFGKSYELFRWLHKQKPGNLTASMVEDVERIGQYFDDMYYYQVFYTEDLFYSSDGGSIGVLMAEFRYDDTFPERQGQSEPVYEAMIAAFKLLPERKRIVICQDQ